MNRHVVIGGTVVAPDLTEAATIRRPTAAGRLALEARTGDRAQLGGLLARPHVCELSEVAVHADQVADGGEVVGIDAVEDRNAARLRYEKHTESRHRSSARSLPARKTAKLRLVSPAS